MLTDCWQLRSLLAAGDNLAGPQPDAPDVYSGARHNPSHWGQGVGVRLMYWTRLQCFENPAAYLLSVEDAQPASFNDFARDDFPERQVAIREVQRVQQFFVRADQDPKGFRFEHDVSPKRRDCHGSHPTTPVTDPGDLGAKPVIPQWRFCGGSALPAAPR